MAGAPRALETTVRMVAVVVVPSSVLRIAAAVSDITLSRAAPNAADEAAAVKDEEDDEEEEEATTGKLLLLLLWVPDADADAGS
jgi:hypothetical protein